MKYPLLIAMLLCSLFASAQVATTIVNSRYKLNGGARSQVGGISRLVVPVTVPYNCHRIVYTIGTSKGEGVNPVKLTTQLASMAGDAGMLSAITGIANISDMIMPSQQSGLLSIYLYLERRCAMLFENKATQQCRPYAYQPNITGGTFALVCDAGDWGKTFYICIMNPQTFEATYFNIEVSALLQQAAYNTDYTPENRYTPARNPLRDNPKYR